MKRPVKKPAPRKARAKLKRHRIVPKEIAIAGDSILIEVPRHIMPLPPTQDMVLELPLTSLDPSMWERFVRWWGGG